MAVSLRFRPGKFFANTPPAIRQRRRRSRLRILAVLLFCILLHILAILFLGKRLVLPPSPSRQELSVTLLAPETPRPAQPVSAVVTPRPSAPKPQHKPAAAKPEVSRVPDAPAAENSPSTAISTSNAAVVEPTPTKEPAASQTAATPPPRLPDPTIHDFPVALPAPVSLDYDINALNKGTTYHGSGNITFRSDQQPGRYHPGRYSIDGKAGVLFINAFAFHSEGSIAHGNLIPESYAEKRFGRRPTHTYFDQHSQTISFTDSDNTYRLDGSEQDRSSMIWQIVGMARANPGVVAPGQIIQFFIAGTRDAQVWKIRAGEQETLTLDHQQIDTVRITRLPKPGDHEQTIDFWLARDHGWLPVRLRYTEPDGDFLDMQVRRIDLIADSTVSTDPFKENTTGATGNRVSSDEVHDGG